VLNWRALANTWMKKNKPKPTYKILRWQSMSRTSSGT
jgi:hypothetical protein